MTQYDFICLYKILDKYENEIEQRYVNYEKIIFGRMRKLDSLDLLEIIELWHQRELLKRIRGDILLIADQLLDSSN